MLLTVEGFVFFDGFDCADGAIVNCDGDFAS